MYINIVCHIDVGVTKKLRQYMNLFESKWIRCSVNPTAGFEKYYPDLWQTNGMMDVRAERFMNKCKDLDQI